MSQKLVKSKLVTHQDPNLLQGDNISPSRKGGEKNTKFISEILGCLRHNGELCLPLHPHFPSRHEKTLQNLGVVPYSEGEAAFEGIPCSPGKVSSLTFRNPAPATGTRSFSGEL